MYLVWGSTQLVRDSDGLVCEHLDTIDFDPEGPTNVRHTPHTAFSSAGHQPARADMCARCGTHPRAWSRRTARGRCSTSAWRDARRMPARWAGAGWC